MRFWNKFFRKIVKEATGQEQPLYKVMEKMARTGRDQNSERTEVERLKLKQHLTVRG